MVVFVGDSFSRLFISIHFHPVPGNTSDASLSLLRSVLVVCFSFLRLYILCGSGTTHYLRVISLATLRHVGQFTH